MKKIIKIESLRIILLNIVCLKKVSYNVYISRLNNIFHSGNTPNIAGYTQQVISNFPGVSLLQKYRTQGESSKIVVSIFYNHAKRFSNKLRHK